MLDHESKISEKLSEIKATVSHYVAEEFPVMNGLYVELEKAVQEMLSKISENRFVEENY